MATSTRTLRGSRPAIWVLAVVALAAVAAALIPQTVLAWRIETALRQTLSGGRINAGVQGAPWSILAGSFRVLQVDATGVTVNQLPVERIFLRLEGAQVDLGLLFRETRLVLRSVSGGEGRVTLSSKDLERYLASTKNIRNATVAMEQGLVTIEGDVQVGQLDLRARIVGRLVIASPQTIDLHVQELTVSGVQIPREVGALLVASINPLLSLSGLPFPARISSVAVEGGAATLEVRVDRP